MTTLIVASNPCATCPYRKDVPSGVWHHDEYERLRKFDDEPRADNLGTFLCHQTNVCGKEIACKGWLMVHRESVAVRLAMLRGHIDESAFSPTDVALHDSGNAAADFGQRDIERPRRTALKVMQKLKRTGKFKT